MDNRAGQSLAGFGVVALLAAILAIPCYYTTQTMSVSGEANRSLGASGALVAGIAVVAALIGGVMLWLGRRRGGTGTRIALVAVVVTSVVLTLAAISLSGTRATPVTPPSADI